METYAGSTNDDIDHIDMKGTDAQRVAVNNAVDFYVRMVLETTENGGFMHKFCQLLPEKYMLRHGVWIEEDKKYKRLESLQITYTNDERQKAGNRAAASYRKNLRTNAFTKVKQDRIRRKLDPIVKAVFPTGEALVPHVEMPLLALDVGPQTDEPLLPRDADVCPTAQAFGLSAQVDAAGPRKKKTKVLRFLSANETDQTSNVSDVSTADSGH